MQAGPTQGRSIYLFLARWTRGVRWLFGDPESNYKEMIYEHIAAILDAQRVLVLLDSALIPGPCDIAIRRCPVLPLLPFVQSKMVEHK